MANTVYLFPLTAEEAENGSNCGFKYALKNKSKWIKDNTSGVLKEFIIDPSIVRDTQYFVIKNTVYEYYKSYINVDESYQVYVLKPTLLGADDLTVYTEGGK